MVNLPTSMHAGFLGPRIWRIVLLAMLLYGLGIRIHALRHWKSGLSNDESVSYMCAAATTGIWEERIHDLRDRSIAIGDIHRFYARPSRFEFHTVSLDMARYDVHPPLYFWLLHVIHVIWGSTVWTGAALNIALGIGLLVTLLGLARSTGLGSNASLVVGVVWYLSPAAVQIDLEARPYQLFALAAVVSFLLGQRLIQGPRSFATWLGFVLANTAGLLTHLYFPFIVLPGLVLMLGRHKLTRPTWLYVASLMFSVVAMLALYPEMIDFIRTYGHRARDVAEPIDHIGRLKGLAYMCMQYFTEPRAIRYVFLFLCAVTIGWLAMIPSIKQVMKGSWGSPSRISLLFTLGWWMLFTFLFFLIGVSPAQAVGEQYFSYIWPLMSLVLVIVVSALFNPRMRSGIAAAYFVQLIISFTLAVRHSDYVRPVFPAGWNEAISASDLLLTDEAKRTAIPRIPRELPAALPLFMRGREWPDLTKVQRLCFLHLEIEAIRGSLVVDRLHADGFTQIGATQVYDRYELRTFTR